MWAGHSTFILYQVNVDPNVLWWAVLDIHGRARRKAMVLAQAGLIPRYLREYIAKKKLTGNEIFFLKQHHLCLFDVDILPF